MADKVYPSSKQATNGTAPITTTNTATDPSFPATKAQLYGASRPPYRPQPNRHQHRRSRCCSCCIWTTVTILVLIFLAAVVGAILYVLYRPHRPVFTVSSLKVSTLNITSASNKLITNINLNVTAKNPNKKVVYIYDPITITLITNDDIAIGGGSFGSFVHGTKNTTLLKAAITSSNQELDDTSAGKLKIALKSKNGLPLEIKLNTKVKAKMGALKTPKLRIRVVCEGIKATVPKGKSATTASTSDAKCKVDLRLKIWKWTF